MINTKLLTPANFIVIGAVALLFNVLTEFFIEKVIDGTS